MNIIIKFYIPKNSYYVDSWMINNKIISRETVDDYDDIYGWSIKIGEPTPKITGISLIYDNPKQPKVNMTFSNNWPFYSLNKGFGFILFFKPNKNLNANYYVILTYVFNKEKNEDDVLKLNEETKTYSFRPRIEFKCIPDGDNNQGGLLSLMAKKLNLLKQKKFVLI
ncbi:hypothetical protein [Ureaplasma urealyticum]|uniref:hypothetical protein n=2 Tax=Ureaplasma urealyticum TaxID=2130 RepID=UPI000368F5CD|nr:hypothetical protein [Ureaplasma urealyticum]MDU3864808.1 hypothetical protein [Ureaplasma urealyticum]